MGWRDGPGRGRGYPAPRRALLRWGLRTLERLCGCSRRWAGARLPRRHMSFHANPKAPEGKDTLERDAFPSPSRQSLLQTVRPS